MKLTFKEKMLDTLFDVMDIVHSRKPLVIACLSTGIFALLFSFLLVVFIPSVEGSTVVSLREEHQKKQEKIQQLETLYASAEAEKNNPHLLEEEEKREYEKSLTPEMMSEIFAESVEMRDPLLCEKKLKYSFIDQCKDSYWNFMAIIEGSEELCSHISSATSKEQCIKNNSQDYNPGDTKKLFNDALAECNTHTNLKNKEVCLNGAFFLHATQSEDLAQCEKITETNTQNMCKKQVSEKKDAKSFELATTNKNLQNCDDITENSLKKECYSTVNTLLLTKSDSCDETCVNDLALKLALEQNNIGLCQKSSDTLSKTLCLDTVYENIAVTEKDSRYCEKISTSVGINTCSSKITASEDKNPKIQALQYIQEGRSMPEIGKPLTDPLEEAANYLDKISYMLEGEDPVSSEEAEMIRMQQEFHNTLLQNKNASSQQKTSVSETVPQKTLSQVQSEAAIVCQAYSLLNERTACEDSLILQMAIPQKNLEACSYIKSEKTKSYCELSIVESDAKNAAQIAKEKCESLSTEEAKNTCFRSIGLTNHQSISQEEGSSL
jgi:hypothetical protein